MIHRTWPILPVVLLLVATSCGDIRETPTEIGPSPENDLTAALQAAPRGEKVRVILQLESMGRAHSMAATLASPQSAGNSRVRRTYNNFPLVSVEVSENAIEALRRAPGVVSISPNIPEFPALDNSLSVINADVVQDLGWDGSGLTIAILDTGIDEDHPFFGSRIVSQACYSTHDPDEDQVSLCPGNATSSTDASAADTNIAACNDDGDLCDHGTHVAGIAAGDGTDVTGAPAAGVAPAANIIAIQVFTRFDNEDDCPGAAPCLRSFPDDQIAGLDRVFDLRNDYTIAAVNMSLGGGANTSNCDGDARKVPIDQLIGANIATAIASGNDGFWTAVSTPSCISTAVTVGATDNADNVTRNRGPLLDLFAPGSGIFSSGNDGGFETKGGTSMAAPHVAGAWAVLRQALPGSSVADILNLLQTTGVDITYSIDGTSDGLTATTPRIDLAAALRTTVDPPVLTVDNPNVTLDEGQTATNTGTYVWDDGDVTLSASIGTVVDAGGDTWSWSFDATDGPTQSQTVTITGTDALSQDGEVTFELVVNNVDPVVTVDGAQVTTIDEGGSLLVTGHFTDPGTGDTHTATVTCYSAAEGSSVSGSVDITGTSPVIAGEVTATCPYGDDSYPTFAVTVSVKDDDGGVGSASFDLTVDNVAPTAAIDQTGTTLINGISAVIAQVGVPLSFSGNAIDPGSDDLSMEWDWDDGSSTSTDYLVNPPGIDPDPSPDVNPRNVDDTQSHAWSSACTFAVSLTATDDDGGSASDGVSVVIAGNSGQARSQGYWQTEMRGRTSVFDSATLDCYLDIVGFMSAVFSEEIDASTRNRASQVLHTRGRNTTTDLLDVQLLATWLNFANGAYGWAELVDTDGDSIPDTPFSDAVTAAETIRLDPSATDQALEVQKDILESINLMHE